MGPADSGSAARRAAMRLRIASWSTGFEGPRFAPVDAVALNGGEVAEGRDQKSAGSSKGWPILSEPTILPFLSIIDPTAARGNVTRAKPVIAKG